MSNESEDFCRKISDGLTFRSNELECWADVDAVVVDSLTLFSCVDDESDGERC